MEAKDIDNRVEEERKEELVGSRAEIATSRTRTKGRMGVEEERIGREVETRRRMKARCNDEGTSPIQVEELEQPKT